MSEHTELEKSLLQALHESLDAPAFAEVIATFANDGNHSALRLVADSGVLAQRAGEPDLAFSVLPLVSKPASLARHEGLALDWLGQCGFHSPYRLAVLMTESRVEAQVEALLALGADISATFLGSNGDVDTVLGKAIGKNRPAAARALARAFVLRGETPVLSHRDQGGGVVHRTLVDYVFQNGLGAEAEIQVGLLRAIGDLPLPTGLANAIAGGFLDKVERGGDLVGDSGLELVLQGLMLAEFQGHDHLLRVLHHKGTRDSLDLAWIIGSGGQDFQEIRGVTPHDVLARVLSSGVAPDCIRACFNPGGIVSFLQSTEPGRRVDKDAVVGLFGKREVACGLVHAAAVSNNADGMALLLEAGADPYEKVRFLRGGSDRQANADAFDIARMYGATRVAAVLDAWKAHKAVAGVRRARQETANPNPPPIG